MITHRRAATAVVAALALALLAAAPAGAAGSPAKAAKTTYGTLAINITKTGNTVWGKVSVKPLKKTCSAATCTYKHIKVGTAIILTETPTNSTTWPFDHWALNGTNKGGATTLKFKMAKTDKIGVVYVVPGGTLTINITDEGELWGKVKVAPTGQTCTRAKCVYKNVPLGETLTLTETPVNSNTWPFNGWDLNGSGQGTNTTLSFTMAQTDTVNANYVLAH